MSDRRNANTSAKFTVSALCALAALVFFALRVPARSQTYGTSEIRIRLIDGRSGKPISDGEFLVLETPAPADRKGLYRDVKSGTDGYATISVPVDFRGSFILGPVGRPLYEPCVRWNGSQDFSVEAILTTGVVSNNRCKRKITQSPVPGVLVFYVRPETWCDRMANMSPCFWE
jgi:hypothetical protein